MNHASQRRLEPPIAPGIGRLWLPLSFVVLLALASVTGGAPRARAQSTVSVTYAAGWNLVGAPDGTRFDAAQGSLFSLQPGDAAYRSLAAGAGVTAGLGYWADFAADSSVSLMAASSVPIQIVAPAGAWLLAGNPSTVPSRINGADLVYTYDPAHGYVATNLLPPGRGAFVYSAAGGVIEIDPAADTIEALPAASPTPTSTPAPSASASPAPAALMVLASGYGRSRAGGPVSVAMLLHNGGAHALDASPVVISVYDSSGDVIGSASTTLRYLPAGATTGLVHRLTLSDPSAVVARVDVHAADGRTAPDPQPGSLSFNQLMLLPVRTGLQATALLTSTYAVDLSSIHINAIVYDASGEIIGGGATTQRLVPASAAIGVTVSVAVSGTPARVEFYAQVP